MKTALIVTGALSALVFVFPGLIIFGMFLLVLPGLVLMAMPTVFLYLLATWLIRFLIPVESDVVGYLLAGAGAVVLASLAMLPIRNAAEEEFAKAAQPEIMPAAPIAVSGHILIEERRDLGFGSDPKCGPLCLAMLDLAEVRTVTIRREGREATFALVEADPDTEMEQPASIEPYDPATILSLAGQMQDYRRVEEAKKSIERMWQTRLSGTQRLVAVERPKAAPDWQLLDDWGDIARIYSITGPDGEVRLRYVYLSHMIPTIPPYIGFTAGSAGTGFMGRGFILGGSERKRESAFETVFPDEVFARALALKDYWAAHAPAPEAQSE